MYTVAVYLVKRWVVLLSLNNVIIKQNCGTILICVFYLLTIIAKKLFKIQVKEDLTFDVEFD